MAPDLAHVEHLCVLVHGFWGNPDHLRHVRDTLQAHHPDVHILVAKSNSNNNTYEGVDVGGERVTNEIEEEVVKLEQCGAKLKRFSIAGYSLGGVISRYAIGLLYNDGFFDRYEPVNFTTFASPHLGIRTPVISFRSSLWNYMGGKTLSFSGQQLYLIDNFRNTGRPLYSLMADPNSIFVKALKLFKHRSFYANTMNDRSVPYWSASFSRTNPFVDVDKVKVHFLPGQDPNLDVILDPEQPIEQQKSPREEMTVYQRMTNIPQRTLKNIQLYAVITLILPIVVPLFLLNAGYQTVQSIQRRRLHDTGKVFKLDRYRTKFLEEGQALQDEIVERIGVARSPEYLPTPPPEAPASSADSSEGKSVGHASKLVQQICKDGPWPLLALSPEQSEIVDNLETVGITKYVCHIRKVRHTHAAIVVRSPKPAFAEGRVVIEFWARQFEA